VTLRSRSIKKISLGEIHLECLVIDQLSEKTFSDGCEILSAQEKDTLSRFRRETDKNTFLASHVFLRKVLSGYLNVDAKQITYEKNKYGKPFLTKDLFAKTSLMFNLSHCNGMAVVAISKGADVGVDVERMVRSVSPLEISDRFFSKAESVALKELAETKQLKRFFSYWTLKESYIKARGFGLSLPLDKFTFTFIPDAQVDISLPLFLY